MDFAVGAALIQIDGNVATAGPVLEHWSTLDDAEVLTAWQAGVRAVGEAESDSTRYGQNAAVLASAFLEAVATRDSPDPDRLMPRVVEIVDQYEEAGAFPGELPVYGLTQYRDPDTRDQL